MTHDPHDAWKTTHSEPVEDYGPCERCKEEPAEYFCGTTKKWVCLGCSKISAAEVEGISSPAVKFKKAG